MIEYPRLPPDVKQRFVDGLRSGTYEQGYGDDFRPDGKFTAEAVLFDVIGCDWASGCTGTLVPQCDIADPQVPDCSRLQWQNLLGQLICDSEEGKTFQETADWADANL